MSLTLQGGEAALAGSKDPNLGLVAIRLKCHAATLADALFGEVPKIGITGLVENQPRTFGLRAAGEVEGYDVEITLEGHTSPDATEGVEYSLEGTTSEDPIETHPDYQLLLDVYGGSEDSSGKAKWEKTLSTEGEEGARNPMHGVESYLVPGLTWTRKSVASTFPRGLLAALGAIDTPPGNPPSLEVNRTWLKIRVRSTWRGNVWQVEETWLLSGPDGWVPEMYRHR